ncbi:hypothetical protein OIU77_031190 [Salix suchowensis]|uniref:Uncharacterized protein n=1 Tax=Salix suchowensis TaxID=1278906 RepID=A0ABQ9BHP8_9ROSI|nr:hypothetical protein OIU77_031190 [Salix suchowensis]
MPLFSHRHHSSSVIPTTTNPKTSKSSKSSKPNFISPSTRYPLPLLVFSLVSLLIGLSGTIFALSAILRTQTCSYFSLWQIRRHFSSILFRFG